MDIVKDLALVDRLCTREFPAEHGRTEEGMGGPGYFIAPLGPGEWPSPEDCYAYETAMTGRFTTRWGTPLRSGTVTLGERIARGEDLSQPWTTLSALGQDVRTWDATGTGRTVMLAVADVEEENEPQLFVVVTDLDWP
jgi:hypothetical protein